MRPIRRWAMLGLAMMPAPALAVPDMPMPSNWLGLRVRPFSVAELIGQPRPDGDTEARSPALGAAPEGARLISFAHGSIDQPAAALLLRDAPRFSRLPGKQVEDYEIGLRSALASDAIALQAGLSYNKFRNLQTSIRQGGRLMTAAAGKAKVYGIEGLARWSASDRLSLFATYAWRGGRLKNRVRDGRKFRLSPDRSTAVGAVLLMPAGVGRIAFTPSLAWRSAIGLGADMAGQGSAVLVNAQLGYSLSNGFEIEALATNLLNRQNRPTAADNGQSLIADEPRVLGLRARLRFGQGG
ncbi:TonB-dependent receptor [Rhizorhabdus dicambivorans]|uniref:TonB-dependent receptor n=1 Tax=Rhizorhabdus dicambivorans TaxID=1850238 RepID=A0A2A4FXC3_9SPHN|nr:TonB-dependent receptor [Rhizorhabdus dicambivorans]ATE63728.1 TonB-dependent receptor [Rhizorhabdus dicambivorans]PCE42858.1 TonB-dependent receptor [Rhizorhabdus dicambivorans]